MHDEGGPGREWIGRRRAPGRFPVWWLVAAVAAVVILGAAVAVYAATSGRAQPYAAAPMNVGLEPFAGHAHTCRNYRGIHS